MPSFKNEKYRKKMVRPMPQRTVQPFAVDLSVRKALTMHGRSVKWQKKDYEAILNRMQEQKRTLSDVCKDSDLPGKRAWKLFVKKHPDFEKRAEQIHFSLPYSIQLRSRQRSSPKFHLVCPG